MVPGSYMVMNDDLLKKLQNVEYKMMVELDLFCQEFNIDYFLYAGTALGAVRHGDFIPWDDDVDIAMTRDNFNKFCSCWRKHPIEGYYFENYLNDRYCQNCHAKLRKNNTSLIQKGEDESRGHHGIWIDLFPIDKVPNDEKHRKKLFRYAKELVFLTRANGKNSCENKAKKMVRKTLNLIPYDSRLKRMKYISNYITETNAKEFENHAWVSISTISNLKVQYSHNTIGDYTKIKFRDRDFMINKEYDLLLREIYGDYMQLPPAHERVCKHNPAKIEFSK